MKKLYILPFLLFLSACKFEHEVNNTSDTDSFSSSKCFDITFRASIRADTFLIDQCKGRVWQLTQYTNLQGEPLVWDEMIVLDGEIEGFGEGMKMNPLKLRDMYKAK
jgi:hypothetical protein